MLLMIFLGLGSLYFAHRLGFIELILVSAGSISELVFAIGTLSLMVYCALGYMK